MSVSVKYGDIALGAKDDFVVETENYLPISKPELLMKDGQKFDRYDAPLELNSMLLDGNTKFLESGEKVNISFISTEMSNEDTTFESPIIFRAKAENRYESPGITIIFDEHKNIYATHVNIKWYANDYLLHEEDFYPDKANYFCNSMVDFYNELEITFYSLNVPLNRLRVNEIDYGVSVTFSDDELKGANVIQEIDPISTSIPINTFDFELYSKKNIEFSFQTRQAMQLIFNGRKLATSFVKKASRKGENAWSVEAEDYIGLMDTIYFKGGVYTDKLAVDLIDEIFTTAKIPYRIIGDIGDEMISGHIGYVSCREALMQVMFAIKAIADTSDSEYVDIYRLSDEISDNIGKQRIMQGQSTTDGTRVTSVELTSHTYRKGTEQVKAYEAESSGIGESIFVSFSDPLYDIEISDGEIIESGNNYAIINANDGCILYGFKYEHDTTVYRKNNPNVLLSDIENIIAIDNATLVSKSNVAELLGHCYDYLLNQSSTSIKIIDGGSYKPTKVSDVITYETEYLGEAQGRIIKQKFSLNGSILVKDSEVK